LPFGNGVVLIANGRESTESLLTDDTVLIHTHTHTHTHTYIHTHTHTNTQARSSEETEEETAERMSNVCGNISCRNAECGNAACGKKSPRESEDDATTTSTSDDASIGGIGQKKTLSKAIPCYVCKKHFMVLHHFYDRMCTACGDFNFDKRLQTADLRGKVQIIQNQKPYFFFVC
jgi:hypothetical protein